ncbi:signal peptidase I [Candidatus Bipolaricaulota bacterium]
MMWRRKTKKKKRPAYLLRLAWRFGWKPGRVVSEILEWIEVLVVAGGLAVLIMTFITVRMHVPTGSMIPTINIGDSFFVDRITYYARDPKPSDIVVFRHEVYIRVKSVEDESAASAAGMESGEYIATDGAFASFGGLALFTEDAINASISSLPVGAEVVLRTAEGNVYNLGLKTADHTSLEDFGLRLKIRKRMYVKRLIAIGGQTVQIRGGDIYINNEKLEGERFDRYYYSNGVNLQYGVEETLVPEGHYFMLGDNSANSADSRYWGFVEDDDIVGVPYLRVWPLNRIGIM